MSSTKSYKKEGYISEEWTTKLVPKKNIQIAKQERGKPMEIDHDRMLRYAERMVQWEELKHYCITMWRNLLKSEQDDWFINNN